MVFLTLTYLSLTTFNMLSMLWILRKKLCFGSRICVYVCMCVHVFERAYKTNVSWCQESTHSIRSHIQTQETSRDIRNALCANQCSRIIGILDLYVIQDMKSTIFLTIILNRIRRGKKPKGTQSILLQGVQQATDVHCNYLRLHSPALIFL